MKFVDRLLNVLHVLTFFFFCCETLARGVYEVQSTSDKSADQVLAVVQELEAAAPAINNRNTGGIGGDKFKIADVV